MVLSKKNKELNIDNSNDNVNDNDNRIEPNFKPYKFKVGTIKKGKDKKYWKVIMNGSTKKWIKATRRETMCQNYLKSIIKKSLKKYKDGKYKSSRQAIAISYSLTKRKFPSCKLVTNPRKKN